MVWIERAAIAYYNNTKFQIHCTITIILLHLTSGSKWIGSCILLHTYSDCLKIMWWWWWWWWWWKFVCVQMDLYLRSVHQQQENVSGGTESSKTQGMQHDQLSGITWKCSRDFNSCQEIDQNSGKCLGIVSKKSCQINCLLLTWGNATIEHYSVEFLEFL